MAGASVNSIDMDDFRGSFCGQGPYPFLRSSLGLLMKNGKQTHSKKSVQATTTTTARVTTSESSTPTEYYRPKTKTTPSLAEPDESEDSVDEPTLPPLSRVISKKKIKNSKPPSRINKKSELSALNSQMEKNFDISKVNAINKVLNAKLPAQSQKAKKPSMQAPAPLPTQKHSPAIGQEAVSYFLITPPPQNAYHVATKKMDPSEENYWKQELKKRQELKNQEQLRLQQEMYQQEFAKNTPVVQPQKPLIVITPPPVINMPRPPPPQMPIQQHVQVQPPISHVQPPPQQTLDYNQVLIQQQELQLRHKQQLEEYEHQRKQNQQLELQQQQLKKLIQDQQWQLQQSKHQQAEQWVKGRVVKTFKLNRDFNRFF